MTRESSTTIAILGGNTVAGLALSFLLRDASYETIILKSPPMRREDLPRAVDLLLVSPGLGEEQREESLAILRDTESRPCIPILTFGSAVEEKLFAEDTGSSWPVEIGGLVKRTASFSGSSSSVSRSY